jgi:hypothetical protein
MGSAEHGGDEVEGIVPPRGVGTGAALARLVVAQVKERRYGFCDPGRVDREGGNEVVVEARPDGGQRKR